MNGVLMTEQSNTYHYKAYLESLLNYNREEGANWSGNADLRALTSRLLSENWHTFITRPHLPPLKMGKCLVPGVQLDFELFLNIYLKFLAIHNDEIKVTLLMIKVTLNARVYVRLQKERQMLNNIVRYHVVRSEIHTFSFDG